MVVSMMKKNEVGETGRKDWVKCVCVYMCWFRKAFYIRIVLGSVV